MPVDPNNPLAYIVDTDDEGASIVFSVTASNTAGNVTVASPPTGQVPFSAWTDIPGATSLGYTETTNDRGHLLRLVVRAVNTTGEDFAASQPTARPVSDFTVTFVQPAPGATLLPGPTSVVMSVSPQPRTVKASVDGGAWTPLTQSGSTWTGQVTVPTSEGDHTIDIDPSP